MKIINLVSAHTGNDTINHGFTLVDGIIGLLILIVLIFIMGLLIKRNKIRRKNEKQI